MILGGKRKKIGPYIRDLANQMGLRDWTIQILDDTPDNTSYAADIDVRYGRKWANIRFHEEWMHRSPEEFRSTCVHELLHCHFMPFHWHINNLGGEVSNSTFNVFFGAFRDIEESTIDAIAEEWSRSLPLPPSKKGKD